MIVRHHIEDVWPPLASRQASPCHPQKSEKLPPSAHIFMTIDSTS
jgi:hypothetical protein